VCRAIQLLKDEFEMNMRLIGARTVEELTPDLVDTRGLQMHTVPTGNDVLYGSVYDPLVNPAFKAKANL
jgi:L-lactate dehydrogenase (cytochrome)